MGRVDVEVRKGSIRCDVWVVGVLGSPREDDVSRLGSFFQSLVRPVNSLGAWGGAWVWMVPVSFHQNGVGLRLCVTTPSTPRG
jgi:hypothetical protein